MKNILIIIFFVILSGCTKSVGEIQPSNIVASPTLEATQNAMENLILTGIQTSFSAGSHSKEFTCDQCHPKHGDSVGKDLIWLNEKTQQVEFLSNSTELCSKCHSPQNVNESLDTKILVAHSDFECISCHQPHSAQASCAQSTCHSNIQAIRNATIEIPEYHPTTSSTDAHMCGGSACHDQAKQALAAPIYHQPVHRDVPCAVCHDTSGLPVVVNDSGSWTTIGNVSPGEDSSSEAIVSHQIGREVDCNRCHYTDNPWGLIDHLTSD